MLVPARHAEQASHAPMGADTAHHGRLHHAAQQFEALLLQELLKPLNGSKDESETGSAAEGEDLGSGTASGPLASFGVEAVAQSMAQSGALGFARQIEESLLRKSGAGPLTAK